MKPTIGTAANRNLSAASMSGEVSPTPTLIAIKLRPQTIATLNAARMSRAVISRTGARRRREGGLGGKRSGEACPLELACRRRRSTLRRGVIRRALSLLGAVPLDHFDRDHRSLVEREHRQSERGHADEIGRRQDRRE